VGEVHAISELTFYARHGDWFAWLVTAAAGLASLLAFASGAGSNRLVLSSGPGPESDQETH
jgi:apolipoprotein N-acyltransferase